MSWPEVSFLSVCDIQGGTQPPKSEFIENWKEGYVRLLQIQDFKRDDKEYFIPETSKLKKCKDDDVLIARYGASLGKILTGKSGAYNVAIVKTLPDLDKLDKKYLYHYLLSPLFQNFIAMVGGRAAQAGFNKENLSRLMIRLPPLKVQKRIAAILDKADDVNKASSQSNEMKESLIHSAFIEFFGDPIINPKGWSKQPLVDVAEKVTVGYVGPVNKYLDDLGVPMFRTGNVGNYFLNHDKMIHISRDFHLKIQKSSVMKNDVLINRHVTDEMKCSIVSEEIGEANCMNMLLIRPGELLDPFFIAGLIQSKASQHELLQQKSGSAQQVVNTTRLRQWLIPVPPIKLQNQYASFATKILSGVADNYQLQDIVKLRGSLIQELIA